MSMLVTQCAGLVLRLWPGMPHTQGHPWQHLHTVAQAYRQQLEDGRLQQQHRSDPQ
jgi:hypothetical protein